MAGLPLPTEYSLPDLDVRRSLRVRDRQWKDIRHLYIQKAEEED
ncbi:hypothetical protein AJ78_01013 [Emergomyces pasteurianus Ep9510]|uniref:Uncharacterized protein n=1 Tax=Emergomyces pasteurianus Ep9510 TaxID=1447872 RepID=A0A1J9PRE4_9EURO|nr:hypothetical protein AJ78_01013 [Emergomyces pasteurianus Ep9510]